jgi:hypothetical protein
LSTVLVLAAGEVTTRLWIASPSSMVPDARYGSTYLPHARVVHSTEGWSASRTNSLGLIDDELRVPRPPVRAILLGDSFVEAKQVARRDDFAHVAERRLAGLEVVSVGCSGRSPNEYANWLEDHGPQLAPDIVVVQLNDWDLADVLAHPGSTGRAAANDVVTEPTTAAGHAGSLKRLWQRLQHDSALVALAWGRLKPLAQDAVARLSDRLHGTVTTATNADPPTRVADPRAPALMDALHHRFAGHTPRLIYLYIPSMDYFGPHADYGEPRVAAFYHAFAARNRVTVVDPLQELRAEFARTGRPLHGFSNSVLGTGHLNVDGHRVVGERLARAIAEAMR